MNWKPIALVVALLAVVAYVIYVSSTSDWAPQPVEEPMSQEPAEEEQQTAAEGEEEPAPTTTEEPSPETTADVQERIEIVEPPKRLANSDDRVQKAAADLDPKLPDWLGAEEQLRKWALMIDQLSEGRVPTKHRPVTFKPDPFLVIKDGDKYYQDSGNFRRWDPVVNTVTSIAPEKLAAYYREWLPLLERAYGELGKSGSFDRRFRRTIHEMLEAGPVPEDAALVRPHVFYEYADPELEKASPVTKWMWRLGSENKRKVQEFLREFDAALLE